MDCWTVSMFSFSSSLLSLNLKIKPFYRIVSKALINIENYSIKCTLDN